MMSPEESSVVASIIGVAGAGFRLSLILNAVSCEVASEGLEVHSISKTVTLFALTLKQTGIALQATDSVHTSEALNGVHKISEDATKVFEEFNDMLDRVRNKPMEGTAVPTMQQRFQWCFKRHRVTYLLAQLDSFKLSLSVIQQVLQLGKLMASTSKHDPQDEVIAKKELIQQERLETQNALIVRYWQMSKLDRLFENSRREDDDDKIAALEHHDDDLTLVSSAGSSQLTIEAPPPEYATSMALVKLQAYSLGELDQTLQKIKESPKDMVQVSGDAIDPLLDRWTRWYQVRERKHTRDSRGRYGPSVDTYNEEDEDRQFYQQYNEREDSPKGYYLEGNTTDWRKPHSVQAKQEAVRRRQAYTRYQPSVSAASSDVEDSPGSNASKRKNPRHHIIDSDSESSDSEHDQPRVRLRRGSASPTTERKVMYNEAPPIAHSYSAGQMASRKIANPQHPVVSIGSRLAPSPHLQRPHATPEQGTGYHSFSSPMPPIHVANAPNPYAPTNTPHPPYAPHYTAGLQPVSSAHTRYMPQRPPAGPLGNNVRPISRDGLTGGRPSSRGSWGPVPSGQAPPPRQNSKPVEEDKYTKTKKNLREGATKGLLGAGAIAGFLEALEGLSL